MSARAVPPKRKYNTVLDPSSIFIFMAGKQGKIKRFYNENPPTSPKSFDAIPNSQDGEQSAVRSPRNRKRLRAKDVGDMCCVNPVETTSMSSLTSSLHGHEFVHGRRQTQSSGGILSKKGSGTMSSSSKASLSEASSTLKGMNQCVVCSYLFVLCTYIVFVCPSVQHKS